VDRQLFAFLRMLFDKRLYLLMLLLTEHHTHPHLASIVSVKSRRFLACEWSEETRYFISSVKHNDVEKFAHYVCVHWGVENNLHWGLDMSFNEDHCRIRQGYAA
jgi:hypothetical protein